MDTERPPVILVSAVGAAGKATLAEVLSAETGLPLLNLARHKPVGDNTLTGVLTSAFRLEDPSKDLTLQQGPIAPVLSRIDPLLATAKELTAQKFNDLVAFVRDGLPDQRAMKQNLCRLIPSAVPSGFPLARLQRCAQ